MKIAFVWYWGRASKIYPKWRDGHRAAIEEIGKKHQVEWFFDEKIPPPGMYDFVLFWGDSYGPFFRNVDQYDKKGIILTTDPKSHANLRKMDVVFVESDPVLKQMKHPRAIKAMGTDTNFFVPGNREKDMPYFYPATFSPWKRQSVIAHLGSQLTCVGTVQPDGRKELQACKDAGVDIELGYFLPEKILEYYQRTKEIIIPAIHGSERTVLEAMSCNILPTVEKSNKRARSYIEEYAKSRLETPREFILRDYSEKVFAKNLMKGINEAVAS